MQVKLKVGWKQGIPVQMMDKAQMVQKQNSSQQRSSKARQTQSAIQDHRGLLHRAGVVLVLCMRHCTPVDLRVAFIGPGTVLVYE